MNQWINDGGDCRTALATQGLLMTSSALLLYQHLDCKKYNYLDDINVNMSKLSSDMLPWLWQEYEIK